MRYGTCFVLPVLAYTSMRFIRTCTSVGIPVDTPTKTGCVRYIKLDRKFIMTDLGSHYELHHGIIKNRRTKLKGNMSCKPSGTQGKFKSFVFCEAGVTQGFR